MEKIKLLLLQPNNNACSWNSSLQLCVTHLSLFNTLPKLHDHFFNLCNDCPSAKECE